MWVFAFVIAKGGGASQSDPLYEKQTSPPKSWVKYGRWMVTAS